MHKITLLVVSFNITRLRVVARCKQHGRIGQKVKSWLISMSMLQPPLESGPPNVSPFISATESFCMRTKILVEQRADMISYLFSTYDTGAGSPTRGGNTSQQSRAGTVHLEDMKCHVCQELLLDPITVSCNHC